MKIYVQHDDGTRLDITEGVQVAYDTCVASMDWGSGFLATDEARAIQILGVACGFDVAEYDQTCRCGHIGGWHKRMGPAGLERQCMGRAGVPGRAWCRGLDGPDDMRCKCTALVVEALPTLDDLKARASEEDR